MKIGLKTANSRTTGYGRLSSYRMTGCSVRASAIDRAEVIPADLPRIRIDSLLVSNDTE